MSRLCIGLQLPILINYHLYINKNLFFALQSTISVHCAIQFPSIAKPALPVIKLLNETSLHI